MPTKGETALRVFGVRSSRLATAQERLFAGKQQAANFQDDRNEIYERYRTYLQKPEGERDPAEHTAIRDDVRAFNKHIKDLGLEGQVGEIKYSSMRKQAKEMGRVSRKTRKMME
jgi:hypothetical protein